MPDESERKIERDTGEQQIRHREAEQREPYLSAGKIRRDSLRRLLQADDDPGLASRLGDVPAAGIHDIDERQQPGNQAQEPGEAQGIALPREEERQKSEADHGTADADHEAEAPEESRDIRPVVARPVLLLRRGLQVIDAAHRACRLVVEHEGEERGHLELRTVLVRLLVNVRDDGEGRGIRRFPERLHRGELHRVCLREILRVQMAAARGAEKTHEQEERSRHEALPERGARGGVMEHLPGRDSEYDEARRRDAGEKGM